MPNVCVCFQFNDEESIVLSQIWVQWAKKTYEDENMLQSVWLQMPLPGSLEYCLPKTSLFRIFIFSIHHFLYNQYLIITEGSLLYNQQISCVLSKRMSASHLCIFI